MKGKIGLCEGQNWTGVEAPGKIGRADRIQQTSGLLLGGFPGLEEGHHILGRTVQGRVILRAEGFQRRYQGDPSAFVFHDHRVDGG